MQTEEIKKGHLANANPIKVDITTDQLAALIDSVIQSIDKSQFGPLIEYGGTSTDPKKIINQAAFSVFMSTFSTLLTKIDTVTLHAEKEEEGSGIITDMPQN